VVKTSTERARYAVGADGYHSTLRERLEYRFEQHGALQTSRCSSWRASESRRASCGVLFQDELTSAMLAHARHCAVASRSRSRTPVSTSRASAGSTS